MQKEYYVYILRNKSGNLYIGVTNNLKQRIWQHKTKMSDSFTAKYNIDQLIYYETYHDVIQAIAREKQLKNWTRKKKIVLVTRVNPTFHEIDV